MELHAYLQPTNARKMTAHHTRRHQPKQATMMTVHLTPAMHRNINVVRLRRHICILELEHTANDGMTTNNDRIETTSIAANLQNHCVVMCVMLNSDCPCTAFCYYEISLEGLCDCRNLSTLFRLVLFHMRLAQIWGVKIQFVFLRDSKAFSYFPLSRRLGNSVWFG